MANKELCLLSLLAIGLSLGPSYAFSGEHDDVVRLRTHLHPPYQVLEGRELQGSGIKALKCVFSKLNRKYKIDLSPPNRNRYLLDNEQADGIFLSLPDSELNSIAVATQPLAIERWKFFSFEDRPLHPKRYKDNIGAVLGSSERVWLTRHDFTKVGSSTSMENLVRVLSNRRVDYALADENAFHIASRKADILPDAFHSSFVRYVPLVAYFSNEFVARNPEFIPQFNRQIDFCLADSKHPTIQEKEKLQIMVQSYLDEGGWKVKLIKLIKNLAAAPTNEMEKRKQDVLWVKAQKQRGKTVLMEGILSNEISKKLAERRDFSEGNISEIFVFDPQGFILGLSQITSDYWQGDEEKYSRIFVEKLPMNFSNIIFDHSTRKFQVSITVPLHDPDTGRILAGITFGLDTDLALSEYRLE
ncbi:hypothetical protein [Kiloniella antarctica]|uniref:Solute-binding protein family 3/N-terminal domain-containing protein n=1 Tax=Kiloniella antarctica TaxID=1550907 RepID=A0ABW5BJ81_9PROT